MDPLARSRPAGRCLVLFGALSLAAASGRAAEPSAPEPLTLEKALALAESQGFDLLLADAAVHGAEGDLRVAREFLNPLFSGTYLHSTDVPLGDGTTTTSSGYALSLSDQGVVEGLLTGKRSLTVKAAERSLLEARANREDALRQLRLAVAEEFFTVLLAEAVESVDREVAGTYSRTLDLVAARYQFGAVSEAEHARIETAKLEADQAVTAASSQVRQEKSSLAFLVGYPETPPGFEVAGSLEKGPPDWIASVDTAALRSEALANRPDLVAARADLERADAALSLSRRERVPNVSVNAGYGRQGPETNPVTPPTFSAGATFELPLLNQRQGAIARAEADVESATVAFSRSAARANADVDAAWSAYAASREQTERQRRGLNASARRSRELAELQYQSGATSLLDLLDAVRTELAVALEYQQGLAALRAAGARLEASVGRGITP